MKKIFSHALKHLSFPDFHVKKMEIIPKEKILRITMDGAWIDSNGGFELGKGMIIFENWNEIFVQVFDPISNSWTNLTESFYEIMKDLCEAKFSDSSVSLYGFGVESNQWIEWKIVGATIHAEFDKKPEISK